MFLKLTERVLTVSAPDSATLPHAAGQLSGAAQAPEGPAWKQGEAGRGLLIQGALLNSTGFGPDDNDGDLANSRRKHFG